MFCHVYSNLFICTFPYNRSDFSDCHSVVACDDQNVKTSFKHMCAANRTQNSSGMLRLWTLFTVPRQQTPTPCWHDLFYYELCSLFLGNITHTQWTWFILLWTLFTVPGQLIPHPIDKTYFIINSVHCSWVTDTHTQSAWFTLLRTVFPICCETRQSISIHLGMYLNSGNNSVPIQFIIISYVNSTLHRVGKSY